MSRTSRGSVLVKPVGKLNRGHRGSGERRSGREATEQGPAGRRQGSNIFVTEAWGKPREGSGGAVRVQAR